MDIKQTYISKINVLKTDIQSILNENKETEEVIVQKDDKIDELKDLTSKLKELDKKERKEKAKLREISQAQSMVDSITYYQESRKKNPEKTPSESIKEKREKAKNDYIHSMNLQKKHDEKDPITVPGFLFFHNSIIEKYGLCPYIKFRETDTVEDIEINRKKWLETQAENANEYFDLYNKLVEKKELKEVEKELIELDQEINKFFQDIFSISQYELYETSLVYLNEYMSASVKTKRIKEKYKVLINNLSILYNETSVPVYFYLSEKYDTVLKINDIKRVPIQINNISYHLSNFQTKIEKYKELKNKFHSSEKYIQNTINNLKYTQNYFIQFNKLPVNFIRNNNLQNTIKQKGNYFKKWSKLNEEERSDRFLSYATYYVDKKLIMSQIIDNSERGHLISLFQNNLITWYNTKCLKYRYIKWNIKSGYIDNILQVNFNLDTKEFEFTGTIENKKSNTIKKKSIIKSIFTEDNEKIINEEILIFVIKEKNSNEPLEISNDKKEILLEKIKTQLKLKKIQTKDRDYIYTKIDEISSIVSNNQV
jgi:hypothetical protein